MKSFCADVVAEEVGSSAWCQEQIRKPKSAWSASDAMTYADSCILQ
ncbi:MAG: DUF3012 domain-containing protein [Gammaproteobacteria bacterium]|nr:DUF3012 domain-containing protein [Gammaproteobacteria bacterium]